MNYHDRVELVREGSLASKRCVNCGDIVNPLDTFRVRWLYGYEGGKGWNVYHSAHDRAA